MIHITQADTTLQAFFSLVEAPSIDYCAANHSGDKSVDKNVQKNREKGPDQTMHPSRRHEAGSHKRPQARTPRAKHDLTAEAGNGKRIVPEENVQIRLNKAIAERGYCSRRKADERILAGAVTVNGKPVINPGERVSPDAEITVDGISLSQKEVSCYLLLNKPVHTLSTAYDPEGRPTVLDLVPEKYRKYRLYPVGRLDYFSEGLILLTNDGSLTNALLHPRYHLPKTYHVTVRGFVSPKDLQTMQSGMTLPDGQVLLPVEVHARSEGKTTLLSMTLYQGINRQIRKMCDALHITILRLVRIAEGPLSLGDLPSGTLRELSSQEVRRLKKAAGVAKTEKRTAG